MNFWEQFKQNIDPTIVVSTVVGALAASGVGYVLVKTGVKPLKEVGQTLKK